MMRSFILITILGLLFTYNGYAQAEHSPADEYYQNHLTSELPSEAYYHNSLRAGPPNGGPGGGETGDNGGVGTDVPLGDVSVVTMLLLATTALLYQRRKKYNEHNEQRRNKEHKRKNN